MSSSPDPITFIYECVINEGEDAEWSTLWSDLLEHVAHEPGTTSYRCHRVDSSPELCLHEAYESSDAAIAHMQSFGPNYGERFMRAVTMRSVILLGQPSAELAEMVAPMFSGAMPGLLSKMYAQAQT